MSNDQDTDDIDIPVDEDDAAVQQFKELTETNDEDLQTAAAVTATMRTIGMPFLREKAVQKYGVDPDELVEELANIQQTTEITQVSKQYCLEYITEFTDRHDMSPDYKKATRTFYDELVKTGKVDMDDHEANAMAAAVLYLSGRKSNIQSDNFDMSIYSNYFDISTTEIREAVEELEEAGNFEFNEREADNKGVVNHIVKISDEIDVDPDEHKAACDVAYGVIPSDKAQYNNKAVAAACHYIANDYDADTVSVGCNPAAVRRIADKIN